MKGAEGTFVYLSGYNYTGWTSVFKSAFCDQHESKCLNCFVKGANKQQSEVAM